MAKPSHELLFDLTNVFSERFRLAELNDFAFFLGFSEGDFESQTQNARSRQLAEYLFSHGQLWRLGEVGSKRRPDIDWSSLLSRFGYLETSIPPALAAELEAIFATRFNLFELGLLMQALQIGPREIEGNTKIAKAKNLAGYLWDHKLLVDLAILGPELRPDVNWRRLICRHSNDVVDMDIPLELAEKLEEIFTRGFNISELEDLALEIGIDFENIEGDAKKQSKARNFALYIWRHKLILQLAVCGARSAPHVPWHETLGLYAIDRYSVPLSFSVDMVEMFYSEFTVNDLQDMMITLGIDYEDIQGISSVITAKNLVEYLWDHKLFAKLLLIGRKYWPNMDWIRLLGSFGWLVVPDPRWLM